MLYIKPVKWLDPTRDFSSATANKNNNNKKKTIYIFKVKPEPMKVIQKHAAFIKINFMEVNIIYLCRHHVCRSQTWGKWCIGWSHFYTQGPFLLPCNTIFNSKGLPLASDWLLQVSVSLPSAVSSALSPSLFSSCPHFSAPRQTRRASARGEQVHSSLHV